jgi:hypothetical protein
VCVWKMSDARRAHHVIVVRVEILTSLDPGRSFVNTDRHYIDPIYILYKSFLQFAESFNYFVIHFRHELIAKLR